MLQARPWRRPMVVGGALFALAAALATPMLGVPGSVLAIRAMLSGMVAYGVLPEQRMHASAGLISR